MKTHILESTAGLTDDELITRVTQLTRSEREATVVLIAHIAEFDRRRLYLGEGCSSTFTWCTRVLHLSEHEAYGRITAARLSVRFPVLLEKRADGSIHLTGLCILAPVLTAENLQELVGAASHRSKIQIREIVAGIRPLPAVPASVRRVRAGRTPAAPQVGTVPAGAAPVTPLTQSPVQSLDLPTQEPRTAATPPNPSITPLAAATYRIQFTASAETRDKLCELQDLLRHQVKDGDPAVIMEMVLTLLLREVKRKKCALTDKPRPGPDNPGRTTRTIPAEVRRRIWMRDEGRCAFRGRGGRRCAEKGRLEFHHIKPFAAGGRATVSNIELRCSIHNAYEAELYFGRRTSLVRERTPVYEAGQITRRANSVQPEFTGVDPRKLCLRSFCGRRPGWSGTAAHGLDAVPPGGSVECPKSRHSTRYQSADVESSGVRPLRKQNL